MESIEAVLEAVKQQHEASRAAATAESRKRLAGQLNQFARTLRQYQDEAAFARAIVDGAALFSATAALFTLENKMCVLRAQHGLPLVDGVTFSPETARAFAQAISAQELVVALRTAAEVGEALAAGEPTGRVVVLPLTNAERVAALLFADGESNVDGLELIAGLGSLVLSRKQPQQRTGLAELRPTPTAAERPASSGLPPWADLKPEQRNLHSRAQRFARVRVSEWQIAKPEACRAGLEQNDLYLFLKREIEAAREIYRDQFLNDPSMVDYLHLELVATAADGDETKLGAEYPGPLV